MQGYVEGCTLFPPVKRISIITQCALNGINLLGVPPLEQRNNIDHSCSAGKMSEPSPNTEKGLNQPQLISLDLL